MSRVYILKAMVNNLFPSGSIRAAVADLLGDVAKSLVSNQIRKATLGPNAVRVSPAIRVSQGETPPEDDMGCPYCAVARQLAAAYRYIKRAERSPNFVDTYQELARRHIIGASQTLASLHNLTKPKAAGLLHQLANLQDDLRQPTRPDLLSGMAAMIWEASDKALDLAEEYQEDNRIIEGEVRNLDEEIAR